MPSSAFIRMIIRTGYFFNVDSLLFSPFSESVMLWSLVTITLQKLRYNGRTKHELLLQKSLQ